MHPSIQVTPQTVKALNVRRRWNKFLCLHYKFNNTAHCISENIQQKKSSPFHPASCRWEMFPSYLSISFDGFRVHFLPSLGIFDIKIIRINKYFVYFFSRAISWYFINKAEKNCFKYLNRWKCSMFECMHRWTKHHVKHTYSNT